MVRSRFQQEDTEALLRRAWPEGAAVDEVAFLRSLREHRSELVLRRLAALLDVERSPEPDISSAAEAAGVSRTMFFNLRRRWSSQRSLRAIAPYQPRTPAASDKPAFTSEGDAPGRRHHQEAEMALAEILKDPLASNGEIALRVAAQSGTHLDKRTLVRIAQRERRMLHADPAKLAAVYGKSLLADISAIDLLLNLDGTICTAVLAMLIERSTGLVVGHSVGPAQDGISLQIKAALRAVAFLADERADVPLSTPVSLKVVVGPGDCDRVKRSGDNLARKLGADAVVSTGRRRFGQRAAVLIGRVGRIKLRPKATDMIEERPHAISVSRPPMTREDADAFLRTEIGRHNDKVLKGLRAAGLAGQGEPSGAMSRKILEVFGDLLG